MRVSRTALGAVGSVVAGLVAAVGLPAGQALADTTTTLPITHYAQMVVAGNHVFISQGPGSSGILVTDLAGNTVTTISGQTGAEGLALSPDGGTLYAALEGDNSISAISTTTLAETADYPTGAGTDPAYLALAGGRIWFGYGPASSGEGSIGSLDLSGAAPVVTLKQSQDSWYGPPMLAAGPAGSDEIAAGDTGTEPPALRVYNVSTGTPVSTASLPVGGDYGALADLAVTPDGKDLVLATGYPYYQQILKMSDLTPDGEYTTATYPDAVAIAANGTVAAGVDGPYNPDVFVYAQGGATALHSYTFSNGYTLAGRGLAWSPDSSTLFAVAANGSGAYQLSIMQSPALVTTALTLGAPAADVPGRPITLQGALTPASSLPAGTTVTVTRTGPAGGTGVTLPAATVAADGSYSLTDTPPATGTYTYRASYAGDATHTAASASAIVQAAYPAATPVLTAPATDTRGKALRITGQLPDGPYPAGARVQVRRTDLADPRGVALPGAAVAANGSFAFTDTPQTGGANTYQVSYAGDATHAAGSATATVQVSRAATSIGVTLNAANRTYAYNAWVGATVHLGASYSNRTVSLYAQPYGGARVLVSSGTVNAKGTFTGWYRTTRNTSFSAAFAGDARYAPAASAAVVGWSYADVAEAMGGYYTTVQQDGVQWKVFHQSVPPSFAAAVAPDKAGECVSLTLQEYYRSTWSNVVSNSCETLNSASTVSVLAELTNAVGHQFRIDARYVHSAADTQNLNTYGAWQYFTVRS